MGTGQGVRETEHSSAYYKKNKEREITPDAEKHNIYYKARIYANKCENLPKQTIL